MNTYILFTQTRGLQTFSLKSQIVNLNILGFAGTMVSFQTTQFCCFLKAEGNLLHKEQVWLCSNTTLFSKAGCKSQLACSKLDSAKANILHYFLPLTIYITYAGWVFFLSHLKISSDLNMRLLKTRTLLISQDLGNSYIRQGSNRGTKPIGDIYLFIYVIQLIH